jgi:integrase/recombinase XerD
LALRFLFTVTLDRPDPSRRVVLARFPRKLPAVLSVEEVRTRHRLRCGPGVLEVASLKVDDIDGTRMLIRVEQARDARIATPCCHPAARTVAAVVEGRQAAQHHVAAWLFPGRSVTDPVSTRQINRATHEAAEAAEIRKRVSPHTLRHYLASRTM